MRFFSKSKIKKKYEKVLFLFVMCICNAFKAKRSNIVVFAEGKKYIFFSTTFETPFKSNDIIYRLLTVGVFRFFLRSATLNRKPRNVLLPVHQPLFASIYNL